MSKPVGNNDKTFFIEPKTKRSDNQTGLLPLRNQARKTSEAVKSIRAEFCKYFSSAAGQISWAIPYH